MPNIRELKAQDLGRIRTRTRWAHENPIMAGVREVITQPQYDSFAVAAATAFPALTTLFQAPVGQAGRTYLNTNMLQAGILPAPSKFSVRAIRLAVQNDANRNDLVNFLYLTWVRLYVSQKPYFIGPSFLLTAGGGAVGYGAQMEVGVAGDVHYNLVSNGVQDQRNILALSRPIEIEQNEQFSLEVNLGTAFNTVAVATPTFGTGLTVYAILDGELVRGVN